MSLSVKIGGIMKNFILTIFLLLTASFWGLTLPPTQQLAEAIARAEGFYQKGSVPNRTHNPGDIRATRGEHYPGQVGLNKHGYIIFRNDRAGWAALNHQIDKMVEGESRHYN